MKEGLVSIVLPVYGVEKYLDRCISSVVNQTYTNIEIILIDDGSKDNCPLICDEWKKRDSRIKVIHKENAGLGEARNTGIENAEGEYICFFDSDDYIDTKAVEALYDSASKNCADAVIFGFNSVNKNGETVTSSLPPRDKQIFEGKSVLNEFLPDLVAPSRPNPKIPRFYMSAWCFMYSMRIIKESGWRFVSERDIIAEDVYSLLSFFKSVNRVCVLPKGLYYYCENGESLSRKHIPDRYLRIKEFYFESIKLCDKLGYNGEIKHRLSKPFLGFTVATLKQECFAPRSKKENFAKIKEIVDDKLLQEVLNKNKKDYLVITRRILYFAMRHKLYRICMILLKCKA